jgi:ribonuclease/clavin/mitogillin
MNVVNVGYRSTNYYVIDVKVGKLLVDCGWPGTFPQFKAEIKRKGINPTEIKYILATHFHPDHAGLVGEFKELGAKLIMLESQTRAIGSPAIPDDSRTPSHILVTAAENIVLKFAESRRFLATLGLAGEIISTPGHSDDSLTLILDNGFVFTGDLPPRFALAEDDSVARGSWDKIYQHNVIRIFPAHGNPLLPEVS